MATHFIDFHQQTGGLRRGDLVIVAGLPGMGKTTFITNVAQTKSTLDGKIVAFFSLELKLTTLTRRMLASHAVVPLRKLDRGPATKKDQDQLLSAYKSLSESRMFLEDSSSLTVAQIRMKCEQVKKEIGGLDLVVVDCIH